MKEIFCQTHGTQQRYAIVCQHLFESLDSKKVVGLYLPHEDIPNNEPFEAWCDECEIVLDEEKGWNDKSESFADFKLVCEKCYDNIRDINFPEWREAI
jgi:hypothetical protein